MEKTAVGEAAGMDGTAAVGCGTGVDSGVIVGGDVTGKNISGGAVNWSAPTVAVGSSCCGRGLQAAIVRMSGIAKIRIRFIINSVDRPHKFSGGGRIGSQNL